MGLMGTLKKWFGGAKEMAGDVADKAGDVAGTMAEKTKDVAEAPVEKTKDVVEDVKDRFDGDDEGNGDGEDAS